MWTWYKWTSIIYSVVLLAGHLADLNWTGVIWVGGGVCHRLRYKKRALQSRFRPPGFEPRSRADLLDLVLPPPRRSPSGKRRLPLPAATACSATWSSRSSHPCIGFYGGYPTISLVFVSSTSCHHFRVHVEFVEVTPPFHLFL